MPVWKADLVATAYDVSVVENPDALKIAKPANAVATVRSERGYLDTKYDASPAKRQKSLRCQFGEKYDVKEVRNNWSVKLPRNHFIPRPSWAAVSRLRGENQSAVFGTGRRFGMRA